jgi:light-regulated signal transduction histidine kinase (bacteriophytochrome)
VLILQDITERKQLADEAARSNKALQQFATVAAHDLQEPLRSIAGFADMLAHNQGALFDEKSIRYMSKIKDGTTRMQTLINDLLNYSRIQTKPQTLEPTDLNKIAKTCISSLNASISKSGADVTFDSLPTVLADASQLSQLFQNLVGNALKFCPAEKTPVVHISAVRRGQNWLFSVEDNGIGILPEFRERIFGVFQRLHTQAAYPGTGIGLAICYTIVNSHGGKMWVESKPGEGSIFYFTIPATPEDGP